MKLKPLFGIPLKSNLGIALPFILVGSVLMSIGLLSLLQLTTRVDKARSSAWFDQRVSLALRGASDYMKTAVSQAWLIDISKGTKIDTQLDSLTDFADSTKFPRNLERVLLSRSIVADSKSGLNLQLKRDLEDTQLILGKRESPIEITVALASIAELEENHPLKIIKNFTSDLEDFQKIKWTLKRLNGFEDTSEAASRFLSGGRGVTYLSIRTDFVGSWGKYIASSEAIVGMTPRELTSYALFVPGSLYLSDGTTHSVGDLNIPSTTLSEGSTGLEFLSPVYVNADLVLPEIPPANSPQHFLDNITLGNGVVRVNSSDTNTKSTLQDSGVTAGVQTDGVCDAGLHNLFGLSGSCRTLRPKTPPEYTTQCINQKNFMMTMYKHLQAVENLPSLSLFKILEAINIINDKNMDFISGRNIAETCGIAEFEPPLNPFVQANWDDCKTKYGVKAPFQCSCRPRQLIQYCDKAKTLKDSALIEACRLTDAFNSGSKYTFRDTSNEGLLGSFRDTQLCDPLPTAGLEDEFLKFNSEFLDEIVRVWNIAPMTEDLILDNSNSPGPVPVPGTIREWLIRAVPDKCIVKSTATLVTGFFVCKEFTIERRTSPLKIIGTVATGKLKIDPSAIDAGIKWSTIFHPDALDPLQTLSGVLSRSPDCNQFSDPTKAVELPLWHPFPSLSDFGAKANCLPSTIKPNFPSPLAWTQFDPICGEDPKSGFIRCAYRDKWHTPFSVSYREIK